MRTLTNYQRHRKITRRTEHGQSFLEFALIVPVLFLMIIGATIISQGFNIQMMLYGAAYEGARVWAKDPVGGDSTHCTAPACDPISGSAKNFDTYVAPVVRQYITNNGYDGSKVFFFAEDPVKSRDMLNAFSDNKRLVTVSLLYPYELPVGNFAINFQRVLISASCTMKRGG